MEDLRPIARTFIAHWGEMGPRWGVNRTVAQIHALLYLADRPLHADEICEALVVARSNVSMSLKELSSWGIIRTVRPPGERRDFYEADRDVWEVFRRILSERKRREIDPTIRVLNECSDEAEGGTARDREIAERVRALLEFFETMVGWFDRTAREPRPLLMKLLKLGGRGFGVGAARKRSRRSGS